MRLHGNALAVVRALALATHCATRIDMQMKKQAYDLASETLPHRNSRNGLTQEPTQKFTAPKAADRKVATETVARKQTTYSMI